MYMYVYIFFFCRGGVSGWFTAIWILWKLWLTELKCSILSFQWFIARLVLEPTFDLPSWCFANCHRIRSPFEGMFSWLSCLMAFTCGHERFCGSFHKPLCWYPAQNLNPTNPTPTKCHSPFCTFPCLWPCSGGVKCLEFMLGSWSLSLDCSHSNDVPQLVWVEY